MAIALVRTNLSSITSMTSTSAGDMDIDLTTPPTAGNTVVAVIGVYRAAGITGFELSDNQNGGNWTSGASRQANNSCLTAVHFLQNVATGSPYTLHLHGNTPTGTSYIVLVVFELSGVKATSALDTSGTAENTTAAANLTVAASGATTAAGDISVTSVFLDGSSTNAHIVVPSGYSSLGLAQNVNVTGGFGVAYKLNIANTTTESVDWTFDSLTAAGVLATLLEEPTVPAQDPVTITPASFRRNQVLAAM